MAQTKLSPTPKPGPDPAVPVLQDLEQRLWEAERRERALRGRLAQLEEQNQRLLGQLAESHHQEGGCMVSSGRPPTTASAAFCKPRAPQDSRRFWGGISLARAEIPGGDRRVMGTGVPRMSIPPCRAQTARCGRNGR